MGQIASSWLWPCWSVLKRLTSKRRSQPGTSSMRPTCGTIRSERRSPAPNASSIAPFGAPMPVVADWHLTNRSRGTSGRLRRVGGRNGCPVLGWCHNRCRERGGVAYRVDTLATIYGVGGHIHLRQLEEGHLLGVGDCAPGKQALERMASSSAEKKCLQTRTAIQDRCRARGRAGRFSLHDLPEDCRLPNSMTFIAI